METLLPFLLFAFVASITPGPTNILVLTNSSRYGVLRTLPFMFGGCAGAALLVLAVGTGLGDLLTRYPGVQTIMSWVGIVWLTWLAWRIFSAAAQAIGTEETHRKSRLGLTGGASLQLVNPKTWMMALAVVSVFAGTDTDRMARIAVLSGAFFLISLACSTAWAYAGMSASRFIRSAQSMKRFNQVMALLLLASAWLSLVI